MKKRARTKQRGMTLIETLIGFLILFFVLISVLQIFSMAYAVNMGSAARTDLTYRAQRVAEVIRTIYAFERTETATFDALKASSGVDLENQVGTEPVTVSLPPSGKEAFWGSGWANVVEPDAPFELSYEVTAGTTGGARFTVTVTAQPKTTGKKYPGLAGVGKAVRYAATIQ